jgi:hypothetical protein
MCDTVTVANPRRINIMDLKQIENEALHLTDHERAKLAQKLLFSLDYFREGESLEAGEDKVTADWLAIAQRRAQELDDGTVKPISAAEVQRQALALLK